MAYFADGDLIQVVYQNGGTSEVATDLGAFSPTTAYTGNTVNLTSNPIPFTGTGAFAGVSASSLDVAYYITTGGSAPTNIWISGPQAGQTALSRQNAAIQTLPTINNNYASVGTAQVTLLQSNPLSYYAVEDKGGTTPGGFDGFINNPAMYGEQNLGNLSTLGYVDSYLYYYSAPKNGGNGVQVATIRTFADGTSEILGGAPTPIPASILLLGSGLAGLVGIRRKQLV